MTGGRAHRQRFGLVTFWVTLLVWWAGYSAAHGVDGGFALNALLPTVGAIAVNSIYTRQDVLFIVVAAFALVIVMAWTTHGTRLVNWRVRGLDYPDLWPEWIGSGLVIAGMVCGLAWVFPVLTSQSTIEWLRGLFNPPTTQAIRVAERSWAEFTPIRARPPGGTGLGGHADLLTSRLWHSAGTLATVGDVGVDGSAATRAGRSTHHRPALAAQRPYWRA
jgi:hypothetical protein